MAAADSFSSASAALSFISLPPFPSPRRLSGTFCDPTRPIVSTRRRPPWVTLQGRLVGESEATSSQVVGKGLSPAEAVAWELFTPLHRVLLVAIIAVASADTRRSRRISLLQRSVKIRDEVLINMQTKLDDLCEQMRFIKEHSTSGNNFLTNNEHFPIGETVEANEAKLYHCGTRVFHQNPDSGIVPLCSSQSIKTKDVYMAELSKERLFLNSHEIVSEPEERRMSDLSDFCCSVASSADFQHVQLSALAAEQELYNLRNECEEKDATIKELTTAAHASSVAYSKRITELEEVIRRKNMIITKLKKDMLFLEQQISKLTRVRRQVSPSSTTKQLPFMTENILYDMSSTSSSSSDCDCPNRDRVKPILLESLEHSRQASAKPLSSVVSNEQRAISPLKENRVNRKLEANSRVRQSQFEANPIVRQRQLASSSMDNKKARRRTLQEEKNMMTSQKKWA